MLSFLLDFFPLPIPTLPPFPSTLSRGLCLLGNGSSVVINVDSVVIVAVVVDNDDGAVDNEEDDDDDGFVVTLTYWFLGSLSSVFKISEACSASLGNWALK